MISVCCRLSAASRAVLAGGPREEPLEPGAPPDRLVGRDRVLAGEQHDEAADQEGQQRRDQRDDHAAAAHVGRQPRRRRLRPCDASSSLTRRSCRRPRRSSRCRAPPRRRRAGTRPRSRPRRSRGCGPPASEPPRTRARRAGCRGPLSRSDTSRRCTNSMAPTSSPRVGWWAIRSCGFARSRARCRPSAGCRPTATTRAVGVAAAHVVLLESSRARAAACC